MEREASAIILISLLSVLTLACEPQPVRTEHAIIIVPDSYSTIQEAINAADEGDTIYVKPGVYNEHIVVNKTLSVFGENPVTTIVDGEETSLLLVSIVSHSVVFAGFTIQRTASNREAYGISVFNNKNVILSDNLINDCWFGISLTNSTNCTILKNEVSGNFRCGIYLRDQSSYNNIVGNSISNNPTGIHATGSTQNNTFYHNNIINNDYQIFLGPGCRVSWDNGCEGNYWSGYSGADVDGDGVGDTELPWLGVDYYPLITPYWNPADVNHDLAVDIHDVALVCNAYGATPSDLEWNPHCDIAEPYNIVDIYDVVLICGNYGKTANP